MGCLLSRTHVPYFFLRPFFYYYSAVRDRVGATGGGATGGAPKRVRLTGAAEGPRRKRHVSFALWVVGASQMRPNSAAWRGAA